MTTAIDRLGAAEDVDRHRLGEEGREPGELPQRGSPGPALAVGGLTALLAVPLAIALVALRDPRWYPLVDMAQIEMRVRDVGFDHPPLLGLGGRIFGLGTQGNHPGPIAFYVMAPVYRLLGSTAWALQAAGAVANLLAMGTAIWIAHRRAGTRGALAATGGLALLTHFYGLGLLTTPWNPYFPILWWVVFLLAVWSVVCRDLVLLPVAVVAGTVAAQTHLPYVGLVGGMAALMLGALTVAAVRDPELRPRIARWTAGATGLAVVLWLPPIVEQLGSRSGPGNVSIIVESVRNPVEATPGLGEAWRLWLAQLDPLALISESFVPAGLAGSRWLGLTLLATWLASVVVAVWLVPRQSPGRQALVQLHVVTGAALLLGLVTISRIAGVPWPYLMLWTRGIAMLTLAAVAATAVVATATLLRRRAPRSDGAVAPLGQLATRWLPGGALAALVLVPVTLTALDAPDTTVRDGDESAALARLAPPVVAALTGDGAGAARPGDTEDARYLVSWHDPLGLGAAGFGMFLELERHGIDVGVAPDAVQAPAVRAHRTLDPGQADAEIHIAAGDEDIERWRRRGDARELAALDARSAEERAEVRRLKAGIAEALRRAGREDLVARLDAARISLVDETLPDEVNLQLARLAEIDDPLAVFLDSAP